MNRRKFIKYSWLLSALAVLNPLKLLAKVNPKPTLEILGTKHYDGVCFISPEPIQSWTITHVDIENKTATFEPTPYGIGHKCLK